MPFIVDVLSVCAKVRLINQCILYSQYLRPLGLLISLIIKEKMQFLPQQGIDTWKLLSVSWVPSH